MKRQMFIGIAVAAMVLACTSMALAADNTWTGNNSNAWADSGNWTAGAPTVGAGQSLIVNSSSNNITVTSDNNTWLDDGTQVDPADPAVGSVKWGGASMDLSGTGVVQNNSRNKNGTWGAMTFRIGEVGVGSLNQTGGTFRLTAAGTGGAALDPTKGSGELRIGGFNKNGSDWNGIGSYTMNGGLLTNQGDYSNIGTGFIRLGESGTGTLSIGGDAVVDFGPVTGGDPGTGGAKASLQMGANVVDTGTNNATLEIIGDKVTVNFDSLAMMGGYTNTIRFEPNDGVFSMINVSGSLNDTGGPGFYVHNGGNIELKNITGIPCGTVIDLIYSANGFVGAENLVLVGDAADFILGLDGTGTILQATARGAGTLLPAGYIPGDLDCDADVDFADFSIMAGNWLQKTLPYNQPPTPDPMIWGTRPYATSSTTIAMAGAEATSTDGTGIEYYFEDADHPTFNSGWISLSPAQEWDDSGLAPNSEYSYRVKARNKGNRVETGWSEFASATTLP